MTAPAPSDAGSGRRPAERAATDTARCFLLLGRGYWSGSERRMAWALTAGVLAGVLVGIAIQVGINQWNGMFFDAIERKDWPRLAIAIQLILFLAIAMAVAGAAYVHVKMRLQVRWREWLTRQLVARWLGDRRFYRLSIANGRGISNPEYRIADDVRNATEPLVDFAAALTTSVLTAATFIGILFVIGGSATVPLPGGSVTIPGFMVLSVLAYSACATTLMIHIGRPLIAGIETRNAHEAGFRYELTRVRENAEQIALAGGDGDERRRLGDKLSALVLRWIDVIRREARMTSLINGTMTLTPVIPLLLCAPKYLDGGLSLGELVQIAAAFVQVHQSLNWLADNAIRVAEWLASAQRVVDIATALDTLDLSDDGSIARGIEIADSPDGSIRLEGLSIAEPSGRVVIDGPELVVPRGQNVLVRGASGSGKSTLVRAIAGLWPWGSGTIRKPLAARLAVLLQRPLIPHGTLRAALLYPAADPATPDDVLRQALQRCGLSHLSDRLDAEEQWSSVLQGGEQQRLAFARLLVDLPDIVIMDEATSALDEDGEARMMELMHAELGRVTVVCVGRRSGLEPYFERRLKLVLDPIRQVSVLRDAQARALATSSGV